MAAPADARTQAIRRVLWLVLGLNLPAIVTAIALYIWLGLTEVALILAVIVNKLPLVTATLRDRLGSLQGRLPIATRI